MSDMNISSTPVSADDAVSAEELDPTANLTDEQRKLMQLATSGFSLEFFSDCIMGDTDDPSNPMYQPEW
ncbi:hypothetical protein G8S19_09380 [Citrobacter sp. SX206]|uniref:hypothetical protein n=1 Tax=Citrobacter TaxID=544 RepID=UPI000C78CA17|nr:MULTISPECIES: hypothetical protein [Citrobacter]MBJ8399852.1 hypothetical protein [Citrobacter youngae]MBJ9602079.1 hypothetical protein [Citrobacter sp. FDAARGOS_156]MEB0865932.1 hypothetical protein [Citrobacter youngae]NTX82999.1 hypothetical protein [Citrobacter youngae]RPH26983.1 hypothetical protein EHN13_04280 [Citrobacter youngae]